MKKITIIIAIFYTLVSQRSMANLNGPDLSNHIKVELKQFIDTVKPMSLLNGKFNVYVLKVNKFDSINSYFTFGYIKNYRDLKYLNNPEYFFNFEGELILVEIQDTILKNSLIGLNLQSADLSTIKSRTNSDSAVFLSGSGSGQICILKGGIIYKKFYEDSDDIPSEMSIYDVERILKNMRTSQEIAPIPPLQPNRPSKRKR